MGKSQKVQSQDVNYGNPSYSTPFGSWSGSGQNFTSQLSQPQQKQLDLSQSAYYDIMKNLPTDGPLGTATQNNFANPDSYLGAYNNAYLNTMDRQVGTPLAQKNAQQYGGDSTIGRYAMNDYLTKSRDQGIMSSANLAKGNYDSMLAGMTGVGSGINDIYTRMMGIGNQGLGQQNSYLSNAQQNANRAFQASQINTNAANQRQAAMWNALADVGLIAASPFTGGASLMMMNPFKSGNQPVQNGGGGGYGGGAYDQWIQQLMNPYGSGSGQYGDMPAGQQGGGGSTIGTTSGFGTRYDASPYDFMTAAQGGSPTGSVNAAYGVYGDDSSEEDSLGPSLDELIAMFASQGGQ